jgi:hypothetical protein
MTQRIHSAPEILELGLRLLRPNNSTCCPVLESLVSFSTPSSRLLTFESMPAFGCRLRLSPSLYLYFIQSSSGMFYNDINLENTRTQSKKTLREHNQNKPFIRISSRTRHRVATLPRLSSVNRIAIPGLPHNTCRRPPAPRPAPPTLISCDLPASRRTLPPTTSPSIQRTRTTNPTLPVILTKRTKNREQIF